MNKKRFLAVLMAVLIFSMTGCGKGAAILFGNNTEEEIQYKISDMVYLPMEKVRTLNPIISMDEDTYYISKLIYESLFVLDENLIPQKGLVSSYNYTDEGSALEVQIRNNVKWHNGKPLTGEDVKFTIDSIKAYAASHSTLYDSNVSNITSVKVNKNNNMQVTIKFANPENVALENLVFPILPKHQFKSIAAMKNKAEGFIPVGTGMYKVENYNDLTQLVLVGNQDYAGEVPQNTLNFEVLSDKNDAINLIEVNKISMFVSENIDRNAIFNTDSTKSTDFISNEIELIGFNMNKPLLQDTGIRKAIAHSIDLNAILDAAYYKNGVLNDSIYFPNYYGVENEGILYEYDLDKALKLIHRCGYVNRDEDEYVEDSKDEEIIIEILVNNDNPCRLGAAQIIKKSLDKLPIHSYIISCSWEEYNMKMASRDYDIFIGGYQINEKYDLRNMLQSKYGNVVGYSNSQLDVLLDQMQSGISVDEKKTVYKDIKKIISNDLPYYCLVYKTYGAISSMSVETADGKISPMFNNIYKDSPNLYCKYEVTE